MIRWELMNMTFHENNSDTDFEGLQYALTPQEITQQFSDFEKLYQRAERGSSCAIINKVGFSIVKFNLEFLPRSDFSSSNNKEQLQHLLQDILDFSNSRAAIEILICRFSPPIRLFLVDLHFAKIDRPPSLLSKLWLPENYSRMHRSSSECCMKWKNLEYLHLTHSYVHVNCSKDSQNLFLTPRIVCFT